MKSSFTVGYQQDRIDHVVLGVTSIVPNLNGFLFFTEDGRNHQIESHELNFGALCNVFLEYSSEEDIEGYLEDPCVPSGINFQLHDHRKKD